MQELTVSSLLRYLKTRLDNDTNIQKIYVVGEISNYHRHFSGHLYFTLKDEKAAINCVMFKSAAALLNFEPKTGDKVIVYANTSIFEASGQLQLYVLKMNPQGLGDLYARYEALKKKLSEEGKFDDDHKIELEKTYLEKVAVLVGDKSAAMSDIKICFKRRWPLCKVDYYPVLVQGPDAPKDIIPKLKQVDELGYDAIILARGGGSFEDLFCFNDEQLVNTIYDLKTFIVTGIGHEQDFSLADFVADLRAATPTAAVELIT
ncbi:MAG: exodeoxyribonuclease VII large subunit, partial [Erysipelotrichaceae bacterium]|nr:exodeoxyribonuclease VII large subunit [Erysipelotrichaceae bacterium]